MIANAAPPGVREVADNNYCIGCGACAARSENIDMALNESGLYQPACSLRLTAEENTRLLTTCPMSPAPDSLTEDEIAAALFSSDCDFNQDIGYFRGIYKGYVKAGSYRKNGSSGGFGKWVLCQLKEWDLVDEVIQVTLNEATTSSGPLYEFTVCKTLDEIRRGSKSAYYPVEMSQVLHYIQQQDKRFAITGIPCFIKAIRLLQREEAVYQKRIKFCVGLICGHLKSTWYAQSMAWQLGIQPKQLDTIDFRLKLPGAKANEKGIRITSKTGREISIKARELLGSDYNLGFFQYPGCDFCDDVIAETADITIGDAWLPECLDDTGGTNIVVVRHQQLAEIMAAHANSGALELADLTPERVVESQAGGYRQRREGLAYRLFMKNEKGEWYPKKRVEPNESHLSGKRKRLYESRTHISQQSFLTFKQALDAGRITEFTKPMGSLVAEYRRLYQKPLFIRLLVRLVHRIGRIKQP